MTHRKLFMAAAIVASAVTTACSDTTAPNKSIAEGSSSASSRSGALHITKECSEYGGVAGDHCTIIASSLPQISVDSRVYYLSAADLEHGTYDGDVELRVNRGNVAFGHCTVFDLFNIIAGTVIGNCSFSGGTGRFKGFNAQIVVSVGNDPSWADWNGPFSFSPRD